MRKYIRLLESDNSPEILGFEKGDVILMNPDGEKVKVEIDIDEIGDEIDDYVKEVSLSGDDGKYVYYFSGTQTDHDDSVDDIELQDWDTLENVNKKEEEYKIKREKERFDWEEKQRFKKERDEKNRSLAGMSEKWWRVEKTFKESYEAKPGEESPRNNKDKNSHYVLVKTENSSYDPEDRIEDKWEDYILLKLVGNSLQNPEEHQLLVELGLLEYPNQDQATQINKALSKREKFEEIIQLTDPSVKKYLKYLLRTRNKSHVGRLMEYIDDALTTE